MRWVRDTFVVTAVGAVVGLLALNWRAQLQTQQKLDALTAALAERPTESVPAPQFTKPAPDPGVLLKELSANKLPPYVIEAPDQLLLEVVVKDPKTGTTDRLPTQPISGPFQVRLDGTVGLGFWGSVSVTGMTLEQAKAAIRDHVSKCADKVPAENLVVVVDVLAYNSKRYYVITDAPGGGEQVQAFPATGSDTVLDAMSNVNGLPAATGERNVKIARRTNKPNEPWQILPVDWKGITQHGITHTNYQILPGDRIYVTRAAN